MTDVDALVLRVLAERHDQHVQGLIDALHHIESMGPMEEPKPQKGSDSDPLLAYEDGEADALWRVAEYARDALAEFDAFVDTASVEAKLRKMKEARG